MATLGEIVIADKNSHLGSGVAFLLNQKCELSEVIRFDPDHEVEVRKGSPYIVAHTQGMSHINDVFSNGYELAQKGLDLISIMGKSNLSIRNGSYEYIAWWREGSEQILRVVAFAKSPFLMEMLGLKFNQTVASPKPIYHESLRYFRLSQVTDDLFDAFRNMYLSFELLLEHIEPKRKREAEGDWLRRALGSVNKVVSLEQAYSCANSDVVSDIYNNIYKKTRCSIFHAKNKSRLLPQNLIDRKQVAEGLEILTNIVLLLAKKWLKVERLRERLVPDGFDLVTQPLLSNSIVIVSDNNMSLNTSETFGISDFSNPIYLHTRHAPELSEPNFGVVLGTVNILELGSLDKIATLGLLYNNDLIFSAKIGEDLICKSIDRLEIQFGIQLENIREPKYLFTT